MNLRSSIARNAWTLRRQRLPFGAGEITLRGDRGLPVFAGGYSLRNPTGVAILCRKRDPEVTQGPIPARANLALPLELPQPRVRPRIESP